MSEHANDSVVNFYWEILSKTPNDLNNLALSTELLQKLLEENPKKISKINYKAFRNLGKCLNWVNLSII